MVPIVTILKSMIQQRRLMCHTILQTMTKTNLIVRERNVATNLITTVDSDLYEVSSGQIQFNDPREAPVAAVPITSLNAFSFDGTDSYALEKYDAATFTNVPYYTADDDKTNLIVRERNVATGVVTTVDFRSL